MDNHLKKDAKKRMKQYRKDQTNWYDIAIIIIVSALTAWIVTRAIFTV